MRAVILAGAAVFLALSSAHADVMPAPTGAVPIVLPSGDDAFAKLAARAAAQDTSVDFRELRFSYLDSVQKKQSPGNERELREAMFAAVQAGNDQLVRDTAIKLLSIDYVDMFGQKFLSQSCKFLHDDACAAQAHFVEFGLLKSLVASGDGKTCKTGWEAVTVDEEYFVLSMNDDTPQRQALINGPPACDQMDVVDENQKPVTYYFRIDAMMAAEAAMFGIK
jgi:hypothetical protein